MPRVPTDPFLEPRTLGCLFLPLGDVEGVCYTLLGISRDAKGPCYSCWNPEAPCYSLVGIPRGARRPSSWCVGIQTWFTQDTAEFKMVLKLIQMRANMSHLVPPRSSNGFRACCSVDLFLLCAHHWRTHNVSLRSFWSMASLRDQTTKTVKQLQRYPAPALRDQAGHCWIQNGFETKPDAGKHVTLSASPEFEWVPGMLLSQSLPMLCT